MYRAGFTLIEFMVVMSLVVILSGVAMSNFMGSVRRGRDVRRQSDLNQYRVALENYASAGSGRYPTSGNIFSASGPLANFLSGSPPADPQGKSYYYAVDAGGAIFVLEACMETGNKAYQSCSIGKAGVTNNGCATSQSRVDTVCDVP